MAILLFGWVGDRMSPRLYTGLGELIASLCFSLFPLIALLSGSVSGWVLVLGMALNGVAQSVGWPGSMKLVSNWFGKTKKGAILGVWASCANVGNIVGLITSQVIINNSSATWKASMLASSAISFLTAVSLLAFIKEKPDEEA
jgi:sugar phosphate permease